MTCIVRFVCRSSYDNMGKKRWVMIVWDAGAGGTMFTVDDAVQLIPIVRVSFIMAVLFLVLLFDSYSLSFNSISVQRSFSLVSTFILFVVALLYVLNIGRRHSGIRYLCLVSAT